MLRRSLMCCAFVIVAAICSEMLGAQQPAVSRPTTAGPPPAGARGGGRGAAPVRSPEVAPDGRVTFRLRAPNAKEVAVAFGGQRLLMQRDDQGIWSTTSGPLAADYYAYSFQVDGTTINDPSNRQVQTSFGSFQSMFVVPGPEPWFPAAGVPRGAVARHSFRSTVANDNRDFFVYTPAGYDSRRSSPYPVLYLLHGLGDDAERWMNGGAANVILNNLDKFSWIASFSGAFVMWPRDVPTQGPLPTGGRGRGGVPSLDPAVFDRTFPQLEAKANSQIRTLWITCGTADSLIGVNRRFKEWLRSKDVRFTEEEAPDVAHVWPYWRKNLAELAQVVFRKG